MSFSRVDSWVWDFWLADDGDEFTMFYLFAPKTLGDPHLRHRNARIGRATSRDLFTWEDHGEVLAPGAAGDFDASATWTGSVVRADDGTWRMFYTGSHFPSPDSHTNIESIGAATSVDLVTWTKLRGSVVQADPRWYETLGTSEWPEEAWRDPWVFRDPSGGGWHMLITARARTGANLGRGVVGHATSDDLRSWQVRPALSTADSGFAHLEVCQLVDIGGTHVLVFSASSDTLSGVRAGGQGGIFVIDDVDPHGPFDIGQAVLLTDERLYSGRVTRDRSGDTVMLAFENGSASGEFVGKISDPLAIGRDTSGQLTLDPLRRTSADLSLR
jgi:beta-fructofuranosidase